MDYDYRRTIFTSIAIALLEEELLNLRDSTCAEALINDCVDVIEKKLCDFWLFQGEVY